MKKIRCFICPIIVCFTFVLQAQAQGQSGPLDDYGAKYVIEANNNAALFIGKLQGVMPDLKESIYLRDKSFVNRKEGGAEIFLTPVSPRESYAVGNLLYDGVNYPGVRMRLDLVRGELVVAGPGDVYNGIVLDPSLLEYADFHGYRVVHIADSSVPDGYYMQLHSGRHEVLRRERVSYNRSQMRFESHTIRYYIAKDGVYHRVKASRGSVLRVFRDRRSEIDRELSTAGLDFKNDTENALVRVALIYENLTQ